MAETLGTWAQLVPSATVLTDLYTVPAATEFIGKVLIAVVTAAQVRVTVALAGVADDPKQTLVPMQALSANTSAGQLIVAPAAAVIRVYSTQADTTFQAVGVKKT